jgi:hypothetical protein
MYMHVHGVVMKEQVPGLVVESLRVARAGLCIVNSLEGSDIKSAVATVAGRCLLLNVVQGEFPCHSVRFYSVASETRMRCLGSALSVGGIVYPCDASSWRFCNQTPRDEALYPFYI